MMLGGVSISYAGFSQCGYNPMHLSKPNQDCLIMLSDPLTDSLVFACLDGHGVHGHRVAQFIAQELEKRLFKHGLFASNIRIAVSQVLMDIEMALCQQEGRLADCSGSTIALAVLRDQVLTVANVGDSRVVIGHHMRDVEGNEVQDVTVDHKPDQPEEYARILAAGGRIFSVRYPDGMIGPPRVWLGQINAPGLAMSRSVGDFIVHTVGVISQPDFYTIDLSHQDNMDAMIVLGTDGLWDVISSAEAISTCRGHAQPSLAVADLIHESRQRWLRKEKVVDDTTVCVVHIQCFSPTESPSSSDL
jgi:serine/threonine protein phosphatase PrpC